MSENPKDGAALVETEGATPAKKKPTDVDRAIIRNAAWTCESENGDQAEAIGPYDKESTLSLLSALGTKSGNAAAVLLNDFARIAQSKPRTVELNNILSLILSMGPKDELEAMLLSQMVGIHSITMRAIGEAKRVQENGKDRKIDGMCINDAVKLARTFTAQLEALAKYRGGGKQKITVEHVHVNEGGQAIVGTVTQGRGE